MAKVIILHPVDLFSKKRHRFKNFQDTRDNMGRFS